MSGLSSQDAFKHSMVVRTRKEKTPTVNQLIDPCGGRCSSMDAGNQKIQQKVGVTESHDMDINNVKSTFIIFHSNICVK